MKTGGGWHYTYTINKLRFLALPISSTLYMSPVFKREAYAKSDPVTAKSIFCYNTSEAEECHFLAIFLFIFGGHPSVK